MRNLEQDHEIPSTVNKVAQVLGVKETVGGALTLEHPNLFPSAVHKVAQLVSKEIVHAPLQMLYVFP
jgi:hypothetical protein